MNGRLFKYWIAIQAFVLVMTVGCSGAPVKPFVISAKHFSRNEISMDTSTVFSPKISEVTVSTLNVTSDSTHRAHQSRLPSWYVVCVGCGSFVAGVGVGVAWCYFCRWRRLKKRAITSSSCDKLPKNIPSIWRNNLKNVLHRVPDIFAKTFQKGAVHETSGVGKRVDGHLQRLLSTQTTYSGDRLPFMTQFSDIVTSEGGEILSPDSDVSVIIPPGAIPEGRMQLIYVNVSFDIQEFGVSTGAGEYQLTPVVECLAPGLDRFLLPVTVKIPHRADVTIPGNPWQFKVIYSQSPVGYQMNWYKVPKESVTQTCDVTFTNDADFVYIRTSHFTTFTCTGCGKRAHPPLKLSAVVYGNQKTLSSRQQVNLRVYVCDASTDIQKRITTMERAFNGSQLSQFKPISVQNKKDWEIKLTSVHDPNWPWKLLEQEDKIKTIGMDICYHCCSSPPSVDFRVTPRDARSRLTEMEAIFSVAQQRKNRQDMVRTQLVTHDFHFQEDHSLSEVSTESGHPGIEPRHVNYIKRHLLPTDMPRVARDLGLTDVDIDTIRRDHRDHALEQIHQMIKLWMTRRGKDATCRAFCDSLEREEIRDVADGLRRIDHSSEA